MQKQVWVIVENDDREATEVTVHKQSIEEYDKAFGKAMSLALKYRADMPGASEITHNKDDGKVHVEVAGLYHHFTVHAVNLPPAGKDKPKKNLFKKGDEVWVSGYISTEDYNCRVDSQGVVEADQKTVRSKVLVTIDYIDGDHKACLSVDPKLLSLK